MFRKTIIFSLSIYLTCTGIFSLNAQEKSLDNAAFLEFQLVLPELEDLIQAAWDNHGMVSLRKNEIEVKEADLKMKKRDWTKNLGIEGSSRYGTFNNFSQNTNDIGSVNLVSNSVQFNYGFGVFARIPVFDVYNRKNSVKQANAEVTIAENLFKAQKDEVKELVIVSYQDLILKQKLLKIQSQNYSDAQVNLEMANKEYTNGALDLYEFIRISDLTAGITSEFERAKSAFVLSKAVLEHLTGLTIN